MSHIGDRRVDVDVRDYRREGQRDDAHIAELLKDIKKDRTRAAELARIDVRELSPADQQKLAHLLAQQLKGQIPAEVAKTLIGGDADPGLLQILAQRLANSVGGDPQGRFAVAATPEQARNSAAEPGLPQQALRWAQFVQRATHVPGGGVQSRAGSAAPKGEGTRLAEMIARKLAGHEGPSLRLPRLVEKALSPAQRQLLMEATFGRALAERLEQLGISDPLMLVKAGALPTDRQKLADVLELGRGQLLGLLLRAELLKVGPGRNGEIGIRPDLLGPLRGAGIAVLGTLAALRGLSSEELAYFYKKLRREAGGFDKARGGRIPVKRDLVHWARTAAHKRSEILLADSEEWLKRERGGGFSRTDAEELVQAWYLENLFWQELASAKRRAEDDRERQERRRDRGEGGDGDRDAPSDPEDGDEQAAELELDEQRDDALICFWITDYAHGDAAQPGGLRQMYVCVDPDTGAIIPQSIERELEPRP